MIFLTMCFSPHWLTRDRLSLFVVWNVGQGLWTTLVDPTACWHVDSGGEWAAGPGLAAQCAGQPQFLSHTHWDWDHINWVNRLQRQVGRACRLFPPLGASSSKKTALFSKIPPCQTIGETPLTRIWRGHELSTSTNSRSQVFLINQQILISGDSPKAAERLWHDKVTRFPVRILVLGHHGSRTSTSIELIKSLPHAKVAIASSRRRRYGHPHRQVVERLRESGIPTLTTENWGTIGFEL